MYFIGALVIALAVVFVIWRMGRAFGPTEAIARWAAARGYAVRGDGLSGPMHVVGARDGRLFTLSLSRAGGVDLLMVAVDCETAASGAQGEVGGAPMEAGGEALAVRIENPPATIWDDLDALVDGLVATATELEAKAPGAEPE